MSADEDQAERWKPREEVQVDQRDPRVTLAVAAIHFGAKPLPAACLGVKRDMPDIKWFYRGEGTTVGQYDQATDTIWLSVELKSDYDALLRTVGHELEHRAQFSRGWPFTEQVARDAEQRFVDAWERREAWLLAAAATSTPSLSMDEMRIGLTRAKETLKASELTARYAR